SRARASSRQALLGPEKAGKPPILSATGRPAMDKPPALVDGTVVSWVARFAFPFPSLFPPFPPLGRGARRGTRPPLPRASLWARMGEGSKSKERRRRTATPRPYEPRGRQG